MDDSRENEQMKKSTIEFIQKSDKLIELLKEDQKKIAQVLINIENKDIPYVDKREIEHMFAIAHGDINLGRHQFSEAIKKVLKF